MKIKIPWAISAVLCFAAAVPVRAQVAPPHGMKWIESLEAGKADASSRGTPILLCVVENDASATAILKNLEDPSVIRILRHFSCVFLSRYHDRNKFEMAYIPWIGQTADTVYHSPALIFGDPKGSPRQEFRVEGKVMSPADLVKQFQKVLDALAPAEAQRGKMEGLEAGSLPDLMKQLGQSLASLDENLTADRLIAFREELPWTSQIAGALEASARKAAGRTVKARVDECLKAVKKALAHVKDFSGKSAETFKLSLDKARSALRELETGLAEDQKRARSLEPLSFADHLAEIERTLQALQNQLASGTADSIQEELRVTLDTCDRLEPKIKSLGDRKSREQAEGQLRTLIKTLSGMTNFKGKNLDSCKALLEKAGQEFKALSDVASR